MTIRQQIATLPEPYRTMAEKYEKDQRWTMLTDTDWDDEAAGFWFGNAFSTTNSDEGLFFWVEFKDSQKLLK